MAVQIELFTQFFQILEKEMDQRIYGWINKFEILENK